MTQEEHEKYILRCLTVIAGSILWVIVMGICVASYGIYTSHQESKGESPQEQHLNHHREELARLDKMIKALEKEQSLELHHDE